MLMIRSLLILLITLLSVTGMLAQVQLEVDGGIQVSSLENDNSADKILVLDTSGIITYRYASDYFDAIPVQATSSLAYFTSYEDYNVGYNTGGVYWDNNRVYLSGLIKKSPGVPSNGDIICALPESYRPTNRILAFGHQSGNPVRIDILPTGEVLLVNGANGSSNFLSLEGISFRIIL